MIMLTPIEIREIRQSLKLTAAQFAKLVGVSENCVWKWEGGQRHPTYGKMTILNELKAKGDKSAVPA